MRTLTHWLTPHQDTGDIHETIELVKGRTPRNWRPAALVPALYGDIWQASGDLYNSLHMDLRPKDGDDLAWIMARFQEAGILAGAWGVPRSLTYREGLEHGRAARVCHGPYVLDLEPYDGFLLEPARSPALFLTGYKTISDQPYWLSVVPQPSGIAPLGHAWQPWLRASRGLRPQCYGRLSPLLDWPEPARALLRVAMGRYRKPIIPVLDSPGSLPRARSDRDLWYLGGAT